jgi:hypothetical protein
MVCNTASLKPVAQAVSRRSVSGAVLLCACLLLFACSKSETATSTASSTEGSQAPGTRAKTPEDFVSQSLELLRQGKLDAWNAVLMSREEFESRCPLLIERNPPGWLDEEMASRLELDKSALSDRRCKRLQSSSTPLRVLWQEGGEVSTFVRMAECEGFTILDPFQLIVEGSEGRYRVELNALRDDSRGEFLPFETADCGGVEAFDLACRKAEAIFSEREPTRYFQYWQCKEQLEGEAGDAALLVAICLEQAVDYDAVRSCWGKRPTGP